MQHFKTIMFAVIVKYLVVFLALLNFGFMLFDGSRALITGDYIRPKSGEYAGQLGPWHKLVAKIGIQPQSTLMKSIFVILGIMGLCSAFYFLFDPVRAKYVLLGMNVASLWYLWIGTVSSVIQILLLLIL